MCVSLGVSDTEFRLHVDTDKIDADSKAYLAEPLEEPVITADLINPFAAGPIQGV